MIELALLLLALTLGAGFRRNHQGLAIAAGVLALPLLFLVMAMPPDLAVLPHRATASWVEAGELAHARYGHTATLLPDGRVLVVGGGATNLDAVAAELYDLGTGSWSAAAPLHTPRWDHSATVLVNGRVLASGGSSDRFGREPLATVETYDPATDAWTVVAPMSSARARHNSTTLPGGSVLVTGGTSRSGAAEIYDPGANVWTLAPRMLRERGESAATLLSDGRVLVVGGDTDVTCRSPGFAGCLRPSSEIFDPTSSEWTGQSWLPPARGSITAAHLTVALMHDDRVLATTGLDAAEYDPGTNAWAEVSSGLDRDRRRYHTATALASGLVLIAGGREPHAEGAALASAELYDPRTHTWSSAGKMKGRRSEHTAVILADGRVLVVGGYRGEELASAEIFDPAR